jgi:thiol-disulfide isomerase/thioredoxin
VRWRASFVVVVLLAAGLAAGSASGQALRVGAPAPEVAGERWINSGPLTMQALRGRVVMVEFWTFDCINCRNVIPQLRGWYERYEKDGFTIVSVHSPEFFWEKSYDNVVSATKKLGVRYPVVQDNDFAIWNRWGVRAWPTMIVIDRKGIVRYRHIGEGEYDATEAMIRRLLAESG